MISLLKKAKQHSIFKKESYTLNEVSGGFGDFGLYMSLIISMSKKKLIDMNIVLFYGGIMTIGTAFAFDTPIPVQPMKSIVSTALSGGLTHNQVIAAGISTSAIVFVLGMTRLIDVVAYFISKPVVYGIQAGLGINIAMIGIQSIQSLSFFGSFDCIFTAVSLGTLTIISFLFVRIPSAIVLVSVGFFYAASQGTFPAYKFINPFDIMTITQITANDWYLGFVNGAAAQIPITILNSVVSICDLNNELFPTKPISKPAMALGVGFINLAFCPLGSIPSCHGASGLAGQVKFGARTGTGLFILGLFKLVIALAIGNVLPQLLVVYPNSILGTLMLISGVELAQNVKKSKNLEMTLIVTAVYLATNAYVSVIIGIILEIFLYGIKHPRLNRSFKKYMKIEEIRVSSAITTT